MATVDRILPGMAIHKNEDGSLTIVTFDEDGHPCSFVPLAFNDLADYADWLLRNIEVMPVEKHQEITMFANALKGS